MLFPLLMISLVVLYVLDHLDISILNQLFTLAQLLDGGCFFSFTCALQYVQIYVVFVLYWWLRIAQEVFVFSLVELHVLVLLIYVLLFWL